MTKKSIAMARGTVVLDENMFHLETLLSNESIRVRKVRPGTRDDDILKGDLLANRIFITNNSKDFIHDAPRLDCGIIATEGVNSEPNGLAKMISRALTDFSLWSKRHGFILRLKQSGRHEFQELTD
jgi:hypothetical protein